MRTVDEKRDWARRRAKASLKRRTSPEWATAIRGLRCERVCRLIAAQIVWWDYFAKKPANPHDATLDLYKNDWEYMVVTGAKILVRKKSIAKALVALGYAEHVAQKRAEVVS